NLGKDGICLELPDVSSLPQLLTFRFQIPETSQVIEVNALPIWKTPATPHHFGRVGLALTTVRICD
ncbi:MAG: hypothetical protein D6736_20115, partial [Nitrospinota bacterium]